MIAKFKVDFLVRPNLVQARSNTAFELAWGKHRSSCRNVVATRDWKDFGDGSGGRVQRRTGMAWLVHGWTIA